MILIGYREYQLIINSNKSIQQQFLGNCSENK